MAISKTFDIGPKLVSAERATSAIRAGSRIYIGTGCAAPHSLLAALEAMNPGPPDLVRRQRNARVGCQWPARLRADLARGGAAAVDERTAVDRRGVAPGFPA